MLRFIALGCAAGGGYPQWNCNCDGCRAARAAPDTQEGQAGIATSVDGEHWFLINASPDIRAHINATPTLHPRAGRLRDTPIAGVILTNGEIDAVTGLLSLREGSPFSIHAHPRVLDVLAENPLFDVLDRTRVPRHAIALDAPFEPALPDGTPSGLIVEAFEVPGKPAWHLEGRAEPNEERPGDTLGLRLRAATGGPEAFVIAACGRVTDGLRDRLRGAAMVMFDGTLWHDNELIDQGLAAKTGRRMGHVSVSGPEGAMARLEGLGIAQKLFVHVNNSNPILRPRTPERAEIEAAGWRLPRAGEEIAP